MYQTCKHVKVSRNSIEKETRRKLEVCGKRTHIVFTRYCIHKNRLVQFKGICKTTNVARAMVSMQNGVDLGRKLSGCSRYLSTFYLFFK